MRNASILLLSLSAILAACAEEKPVAKLDPSWCCSSGKPYATRLKDAGAPGNAASCCEGIYRGAQPSGEHLRYLQKQGFKTIVSLRSWFGEGKSEVEKLGMKAVSIPIQADVRGSEPPTEAQLKMFFETVLDPKNQPVYFHCAHGKDRTGTMAAIYRIEVDGWSADEAIQEMQAFGYNDIWNDLINFVRAYKRQGYADKLKAQPASQK